MSLITRCPACTTMFKVVPDQLRISDGWVRCGQCDEVFDANANFYTEAVQDAPVEKQPPQQQAIPEPVEAESPQEPSNDWAKSLQFEPESVPEKVAQPDPVAQTGSDDFSDWEGADVEVLNLGESREAQTPNAPIEPVFDDFLQKSPRDDAHDIEDVEAKPASQKKTASHPAFPSLKIDPLVVDAKLSFMRPGATKSRWHGTAVRAVLSVLVLGLVSLFALQVVVMERDRLAAGSPQVKELLLAMCDALDCQIAPLKQIESVVIDSSAFTKVRADVYRLSFTFKNTSLVEVAVPALEITLTDMQDRSAVRKVLTPAEMGFKSAALGAGAEFSATLPISVKTASSTERISGYRLLAFYP